MARLRDYIRNVIFSEEYKRLDAAVFAGNYDRAETLADSVYRSIRRVVDLKKDNIGDNCCKIDQFDRQSTILEKSARRSVRRFLSDYFREHYSWRENPRRR